MPGRAHPACLTGGTVGWVCFTGRHLASPPPADVPRRTCALRMISGAQTALSGHESGLPAAHRRSGACWRGAPGNLWVACPETSV